MPPSTTVPTGGSYSKPADTCLDLNLVNADNGLGSNETECYIGYYYSGGRWIAGVACRNRKPNAPKFGAPVVLVSNIATGTRIGVSWVSHNASVSIEY